MGAYQLYNSYSTMLHLIHFTLSANNRYPLEIYGIYYNCRRFVRLWGDGNEGYPFEDLFRQRYTQEARSIQQFFEQPDKRNLVVRKQVGLYKFENVEHGIVCTICVNPKDT